jgi:5-methylcytosine-specific restriction protein A
MKRKLTEPLEIFAAGENYTARGLYQLDERVRIFKGSLISPITTNSTRGKIAQIRMQLFKTIVKDNYFIEDYTFENHSEAASVISGSMRNDNGLFKTIEGITLRDYMEVPYNPIDLKSISRILIEEDDSKGFISSVNINPVIIGDFDHKPEPLDNYLKDNTAKVYRRNHNVVEIALTLSEFKCEIDKNHSSFLTKNGSLYVEGHHLVPLSAQGNFSNSLDVVGNIVILCPNCHRQLHYGSNIHSILKSLFEKKNDFLNKSGIQIEFNDLIRYYQ